MIYIPTIAAQIFQRVTVICAIQGQEIALAVLRQIAEGFAEELQAHGTTCKVFASIEQMNQALQGHSNAVLLFESNSRSHFSPTRKSRGSASTLPTGACAEWGVSISPNHLAGRVETKFQRIQNCARQIGLWFLTDRFHQIGQGDKKQSGSVQLPWGSARKHENVSSVTLVGSDEIVTKLNQGPNFARHMASTAHAAELPEGSRISWVRVPRDPITCDQTRLEQALGAFRQFEAACHRLVSEREEIQHAVLQGVTFIVPERLRQRYLFPPSPTFSVQRLDMHLTISPKNDGSIDVALSENDEMPGGCPDAFFLDEAYGVNADRWAKAFAWLLSEGPLVFLVSSEWSGCYIEEFQWLTEQLSSKGFCVRLVTTENFKRDLHVSHDGIFLKDGGERVGTIWRQVPIFEFDNDLADVVDLAAEGKVRMVPEFSHLGNKVWFALYWRYKAEFQSVLSPDIIGVLDTLMPRSYLVKLDGSDFPQVSVFGSGGSSSRNIESIDQLIGLTPDERDQFVLKVCGANNQAARSYGVLMGHGLSNTAWSEWIQERQTLKQPFIVQSRFKTALHNLPVHHTSRGAAEMFRCRMLMRPWTINGELVSAPICAVPHTTERVHGMVDMAMLPVKMTKLLAAA